jgi:hypothetical protein
MLMRFHYSLGVGHMYSHEVMDTASAPGAPTTNQLDSEDSETEEVLPTNTNFQALEDEDDFVGAEEVNLFEQEQNGSTESLIEALEEMYTDHVFDYED